ncbi:hypothetical protein HDV02_003476 [Globomyces sp. JEL0801]|nr:hypothetical protein HDV02_003476 [Globomyces sp. JEL0801]
MDGNRRYARKKSLQPHQGHAFGFEQLHQTLDWSMKLGVKVVTVYAFSIDNFKRSQIEIDTIFDLAERKFDEFLKEDALIQKHGICVKLIGNLELLRQTTKDAAYKLMWNTRNNVNATLYIACPYTSIEEMNTVLGGIYQNLQQTNIGISDISREFIGKCLYTKEPLDLLIRTSGEKGNPKCCLSYKSSSNPFFAHSETNGKSIDTGLVSIQTAARTIPERTLLGFIDHKWEFHKKKRKALQTRVVQLEKEEKEEKGLIVLSKTATATIFLVKQYPDRVSGLHLYPVVQFLIRPRER